jgi:multidrug transporter EmrE-like cation transporter
MTSGTIGLILSGVLLNTIAQFLLKAGTRALGSLQFADRAAFDFFFAAATSPYIIGGLVCYVASFGLWIGVLSRLDVSVAYPLLSIGYVISAFAAYYVFGEPLSANKLAGIGLILLGVIVLSRA